MKSFTRSRARGRELRLGPRRGALQRAVQVGERERHVLRVGGERVGGDSAGVLFRACGGVALGQLLQQRHAALADHPLGRLGDDAVDALDLAGFASHRIVRDVEVGLLDEPVALQLEQQVLPPERLPRADDTGQQLVQHARPDLAPGLPPGEAQRVRMLRPEDGTVGVVVEDGEFRTPEEDDLGPGREQHAHRAAQALRPRVGRSERGLRPIEAAHARTHFPPALEEREVRSRTGRPLRHSQIMSHGRGDRSPSGPARWRERRPAPRSGGLALSPPAAPPPDRSTPPVAPAATRRGTPAAASSRTTRDERRADRAVRSGTGSW